MKLEGMKLDSLDQQVGVDAIKAALKQPCIQIATNAGEEGAVVVQTLTKENNLTAVRLAQEAVEECRAAGLPERDLEEAIGELPSFCEMPPAEVKWVKDMLEYNGKGG